MIMLRSSNTLSRIAYLVFAAVTVWAVFMLFTPGKITCKPAIYGFSDNLRYNASFSNNTITIHASLELHPWTKTKNETLFCIYGLGENSSIEIESRPPTKTYVSEGAEKCVAASVENSSPEFRKIRFTIKIAEKGDGQSASPLPAVLAGVALAGASYALLNENGREKFFSALSIPVSYFIYDKNKVLENGKRRKIYETLLEEPGHSMRYISRKTGISFGEVQWHLSVLERTGLVRKTTISKWTIFYPAGTPIEVWLHNFIACETSFRVDRKIIKKLSGDIEKIISSKKRVSILELKKILANTHTSPTTTKN